MIKHLRSCLGALVTTVCLVPPPIFAQAQDHPRSNLKDLKSALGKLFELEAKLEEVRSSNLFDEEKAAATEILHGEIQYQKSAIREQMKRFQDLLNERKGLIPPPAEAAPDANDPANLYFQGWLLSRDAGKLADEQKPGEALEKLDRARQLFDRIARDFPDWKPEMVKGRRAQTAETSALLSKQVSPPQPK